jgi:hypothetical protein
VSFVHVTVTSVVSAIKTAVGLSTLCGAPIGVASATSAWAVEGDSKTNIKTRKILFLKKEITGLHLLD